MRNEDRRLFIRHESEKLKFVIGYGSQDEGESIVFVSSLQPPGIPGVSRQWTDQQGAPGSKITRARFPSGF